MNVPPDHPIRNDELSGTQRWLGYYVTTVLVLAIALGINALPGCSVLEFGSKEEQKLRDQTHKDSQTPQGPGEPTVGKKVRWDGGGVIIGETDTLAFTEETLLKAIDKLLQERRFGTVKHLIKQYPGIALKTLREADPGIQNPMALRTLAQIFDALWCKSETWQKYLDDLSRVVDQPSGQLETRKKFWQHLRSHEPESALKLRLTKTLQRENGSMIRAEFYRLESIAAMMNGDHEESIQKLEQAIDLTEKSCPFLTTKLQLLLGEFYRHAGQWDLWKSTWRDAVAGHSQLLVQQELADPVFWTRAAFLRPAGFEWPSDVISNLNNFLVRRELVDGIDRMKLQQDEAVLWVTIGAQHLSRAEGQNAILAFKKAEAVENNPLTIANLQLLQARSMIAAGQPGAASAILFRLASEQEKQPLGDRAKAILGSMKLQNGSVAQGLNLIQSAIESVDSWPRDERLRAQADYALALLVRGRESDGMRLLDQVQSEFEAAGMYDQARQCLWNKSKYFEKTKQPERLQTATAEMADLEARMY